MIGDSTMNGIFNSLACLLRHRQATGHLEPWDRSEVSAIRGEYMSRSGGIYLQVRCKTLPCPFPLSTLLPLGCPEARPNCWRAIFLSALAGCMREGSAWGLPVVNGPNKVSAVL